LIWQKAGIIFPCILLSIHHLLDMCQLSTSTTGSDIFEILKGCVENSRLEWTKLDGFCIDGAPAVIGKIIF
jgi:hypothetical protein